MPAPLEISLRNVHKSFGQNHVLTGISLDVPRGQMVAIVGGSGSGKTVLLRLIMGHFQPNAGEVLVADHESPGSPLTDLATLDERGMDRLRRHWAMVFQGNALFAGSVYDNVALALREVKGMDEPDIRQRVDDSLRAVELDPDKVASLDRSELSGGMAKRVGIARAIALEPVLMFYDEPTSGLDPHLAQQIHELILGAHEQHPDPRLPRTTLIVTHDKDLLYHLQPRVIMLHHGQIFFDGPYAGFAQSTSPVIRPYFNFMPELHLRCKEQPHLEPGV
jgi:phospholipid/cholesterol/gamma-HCH transport system ATP-binding protein